MIERNSKRAFLAKIAVAAALTAMTLLDAGCCDKSKKADGAKDKPLRTSRTRKPAVSENAQALAEGALLTQSGVNADGQPTNLVNRTIADPSAVASAELPTTLSTPDSQPVPAADEAASSQAFARMSNQWRQADAATDPEQRRLLEGSGAYYQGIGQANLWPHSMSRAEAEQGIEEWSEKYRNATTESDRMQAFNRWKYYQGWSDVLNRLPEGRNPSPDAVPAVYSTLGSSAKRAS